MGDQSFYLKKSCRKFDEMPRYTKKIVWLFGQWGEGGKGGKNVHLNQSFRKFDEMPKSTKKI